MPTFTLLAVFLALWIVIGLSAALLFLGRRGYRDARWYLLGAALGPLFVPIAMERGQRTSSVVERVCGNRPAGETPKLGGLTVLVGVDGSPESDRAVREAARLFGHADTRVVLTTVVDPDVEEFGDRAAQRRAHDLLADRASWLPPDVRPVLEVAAGQPDRVLLEIAASEQADAIFVGRRGHGVSHRLLGSVAESVTDHATMPVLLASPVAHDSATQEPQTRRTGAPPGPSAKTSAKPSTRQSANRSTSVTDATS